MNCQIFKYLFPIYSHTCEKGDSLIGSSTGYSTQYPSRPVGLLFFNRISSLTIIVSVTFWQILKRIHIPVKEVQLKLIQRENLRFPHRHFIQGK